MTQETLDRIEELNRMADEICKQHPADYHRRSDFQGIVDQRSKLLQTGGGGEK